MHRDPIGQEFRKLQQNWLFSASQCTVLHLSRLRWWVDFNSCQNQGGGLTSKWLLSSLMYLTSGLEWLKDGLSKDCEAEHLHMVSPFALASHSTAGRLWEGAIWEGMSREQAFQDIQVKAVWPFLTLLLWKPYSTILPSLYWFQITKDSLYSSRGVSGLHLLWQCHIIEEHEDRR